MADNSLKFALADGTVVKMEIHKHNNWAKSIQDHIYDQFSRSKIAT